MLDYRIQTFLTLYDEMNYRRTAEKLNMTQPGVTQHIHHLENFYGVKLFEYDGRKLTRTRCAELLKKHIKGTQSQENALRKSFVPANTLHLRVGATKTIGEFVITDRVRAFLAHPGHNLDLVIDNTEHLLGMLERSELDFAIIEGVFDKNKYRFHLFQKENFTGICAAAHPFAGKTVSLEEAFRECLVVREMGSGTRMLLQQAVHNLGYSLESFHRCSTVSNFSVICELVASGNAITFAYAPIARCRNDLSTFTIDGMQIRGEFNFVYYNDEIAQPQIEHFFCGN